MTTIVLIEPKIPQNTGTIARLCAANDTPLWLVGDLGFSLDDKYLKRAGLDYWAYVTLRHIPNVSDFFKELQASKKTPWLLSSKTTRPYTDAAFGEDDVLIFGSETEGLSPEIKAMFPEQLLTIPMKTPHVRSLNVANAVSIVFYEALRQVGLKVS